MDNYPKERVPFQERLRLRNLGEFKAGEANCLGRLSCMQSPWDSWPGGTRHCLPPLPFLCPWGRCPASSCGKDVLPLAIPSTCTLTAHWGGPQRKGPSGHEESAASSCRCEGSKPVESSPPPFPILYFCLIFSFAPEDVAHSRRTVFCFVSCFSSWRC